MPDRTSLIDRPIDPIPLPGRERARHRLPRVAVVENGGAGEDGVQESGRDGDVVVARRAVGGDEHRHGLADVNVERGVHVLDGVDPFHLHQLHLVVLDPKIERALQPDVRNPKPVSLACINFIFLRGFKFKIVK